jgi:hypothetical protein
MAVILDRPRHNNSQRRHQFPLRRPLVSPGVAVMGPADRRQLNGESQRSAARLCFCGTTIATVDEHIFSAHRGVGA